MILGYISSSLSTKSPNLGFCGNTPHIKSSLSGPAAVCASSLAFSAIPTSVLRTSGCSLLSSSSALGSSLSIPRISELRSFMPMATKSKWLIMTLASLAAVSVSIIAPIFMPSKVSLISLPTPATSFFISLIRASISLIRLAETIGKNTLIFFLLLLRYALNIDLKPSSTTRPPS